MAAEAEVRVTGQEVNVLLGKQILATVPIARLVEVVSNVADRRLGCQILPRGVRMWIERRSATAVAIEIPPHVRTVRWIADDSEAPFGKRASYRSCFLGFPYIVLLIVFREGSLTGLQQLYYRKAPLEEKDEELLLPNLYNVAEGYGQRCWVCLANMKDVGPLDWPMKIAAVSDHVFSAAFNRSSDEHEGNSYWEKMRGVDERVSTVEAWEAATRANQWFALDVPWHPAGTSLTSELGSMLDRVVQSAGQSANAAELAGWIMGNMRGRERRRRLLP